MRLNKLHQLQTRFNETGKKGVIHLDDHELHDMIVMLKEVIDYFRDRGDSDIILRALRQELQTYENCEFARKNK